RYADERDVVDARVLDARLAAARDEPAKIDVAVLIAAADDLSGGDLVDVVRDLDRVPVERDTEVRRPRRTIYGAERLRPRLLGLNVRRAVREGRDPVRHRAGRIDQIVRDVADSAGPVELLAHRRGAHVLRDRRAQAQLVVDRPVEPAFP